ncbi:MAG: DMT family transporter, partial [Candidatus Colwellbacteria bacterium]|nr:DMT family transporter [Candidatus Colwellbacteria bacterium]
MDWQLLALVGVLGASAASVLQRAVLRRGEGDTVAYAIIYQVLSGIVILAYALYRGFNLDISSLPLANVFAMLGIYSLSNVLIFKALRSVEASEFSVLWTASPLWAIFAAYIFLGEFLTPIQAAGAVLVIGAS